MLAARDKPERLVQKRMLDFTSLHWFRFMSEYDAEGRKKFNNGMATSAPLTTTASNPRMSAKAVQRWLYVMGYDSL